MCGNGTDEGARLPRESYDTWLERAVHDAMDPHAPTSAEQLGALRAILDKGGVSAFVLRDSIEFAYECGRYDVAKELLSYAAKYRVSLDEYDGRILWWAVEGDDDPSVVVQLLRAGASVTRSALVEAAVSNNWKIFRALVRAAPSSMGDWVTEVVVSLMDSWHHRLGYWDRRNLPAIGELAQAEDHFTSKLRRVLAIVAELGA